MEFDRNPLFRAGKEIPHIGEDVMVFQKNGKENGWIPDKRAQSKFTPGTWVLGFVLILITMLLSSCFAEFAPGMQEPNQCSRKRLDAAVITFEDAKSQLQEHFKIRNDTSLIYAYHSSVDAVNLARSIKKCFDFTSSYKEEAISLIRSNIMFQRLVVSNMRDSDPGVAISLFRGDYVDIIKNDIN